MGGFSPEEINNEPEQPVNVPKLWAWADKNSWALLVQLWQMPISQRANEQQPNRFTSIRDFQRTPEGSQALANACKTHPESGGTVQTLQNKGGEIQNKILADARRNLPSNLLKWSA